MPQRVDYEAIPSTRYDQYVFKLRNVLNQLAGGPVRFKTLRDFLRKQGMWDRDKAPTVFSIIDVSWDKKSVAVGKFAKRLANASDEDFQRLLFDRLRELNILLVKYVLEALDVEAGGRLHSVHELYRMITSYVYPGDYITLPSFQAWIDWMAATGFIKLVGIRWALSDKGIAELVELKAMDVEEILEDLADEDDEDDEDDDEGFGLGDSGAPSGGGSGDDFGFDDEDLFADLPPEPPVPSPDEIAAAEAAFGDEFEDVPGTNDALPAATEPRRPRPAAPARVGAPSLSQAPAAASAAAVSGVHAPLALRGWPTVATVSIEDADTAALAARITGWYQALSAWPAYEAPRLGVEVAEGASELALLVELGVLAVLVEGLPVQPQVFAFVRRLRATTFFASLGYGEGLEECLDAMEKTGQEPWARALFERLVHARFIARRASMKLDLMPSLRAAEDGPAAIALLREHLLGTHWVEAPFWVARELIRLGLLDGDVVGSVAAVPTRRLITNAQRVGLTARTELHDFDAILALAQQVAGLFGAEAGYGAALERLDDALGLRLPS
ncbi:MAG: hypothetical protein CSA66_00430 [Proteobacteria bacterium]|nr:MAG: hypothetical protein CSA66_00430 [Pseudomonadota bacterium]